MNEYCDNLIDYRRRTAVEVSIGGVNLGGDNPIRVQSMTTVDTMDTEGSIEQCIRMIDAGCEYIRLTAPSIKEAQNLENILKGLRDRGYSTPLIADIHFTPNAAELAAKLIEKVRINPGNYADKKKFQEIDYTDESYAEELLRIREKFVPLIQICKEYDTALRIGTNHGSLSDRIMSRYGDNPEGMVESALEFLRICRDEEFDRVVVSMKSSNTQVMVQAYRLLSARLKEENLPAYPLHLGVTEAGEGEDGRIKSAVGIGTLLEDGLGDTVRVSLTEEPEFEAPVAKALVDRYSDRAKSGLPIIEKVPTNPYGFDKRKSTQSFNIGAGQVPRVIADLSSIQEISDDELKNIGHHYLSELDKWSTGDLAADFVYVGDNTSREWWPSGVRPIVNASSYSGQEQYIPCYSLSDDLTGIANEAFLLVKVEDAFDESSFEKIVNLSPGKALIVYSDLDHWMPAVRRYVWELMSRSIQLPVLISRAYAGGAEDLQIHAGADMGGLFIDGLVDGVMLSHSDTKLANSTAFGVLQAARARITKTEYISCPSCGRTLFDLQETTAMIRERTDHLKGVKIGIMGCIVNGPGEMADADFGYVGSGVGKITLYKGQEVVKKGVPTESAVDELIGIIKADGVWVEPGV